MPRASVERSNAPEPGGHGDHRARRAGQRRRRVGAARRETTRSTSATPRAARTGTTSRSGRRGRAADDPPQPPERRRRPRRLRADHRSAPNAASRRRRRRSAGEVPFVLEQRTQSITPEALTDVPQNAARPARARRLRQPRPRRRGSGRRLPGGRTYTIQVSSFDGDFSNDPWLLRVERRPAIPLPDTCTNPQGPGGGVTKPMPVGPGEREHALSLRLEAVRRPLRPPGRERRLGRLQTLAARTDAAGGAVIPVDANAAVLTPSTPGRGLLLAREGERRRPGGRHLLDNPLIVTPSVKYIVVVGDDAAGIPFGRVLDNTAYANERGYASTFYGDSNNQYLSTYGLGFLPTDDPLGDVNYSGKGPTCPSSRSAGSSRPRRRSSARSPSTSTERRDQPDEGSDHRLRLPRRRRSADLGGLQGRAGHEQRTGADHRRLVEGEPAHRDVPDVEPARARLDQRSLRPLPRLPADENAAQREEILFTTADLAGRSTSGRVIFTMGCHSVLPVSDFVSATCSRPTGRRRTPRPEPSSIWATPATASATPPPCSIRRS